MKKLILASTIAALSLTAAHASTTVYGKAGIGIEYTDTDDGDIELKSASTRIGVKGGEQITANTKAIYQLEYDLATDEGTTDFVSRDTFVGFENAQGSTLKAGRLTSIDDAVDFTNPSEAGGTMATLQETRWDNSLVYSTGDMGGLEFLAQYAVNEIGSIEADDGTMVPLGDDAFGLAGKYTSGPVSAGAAYLSYNDVDTTAMRVSAALAVSPAISVSGLYQITDFDVDDNENALTVAATYDVLNTPWDVYAQFDMLDFGDDESTIISAGANYAFTAATTGHIYAGVEADDDDDSFGLGAKIVHAF